ncbi:hypothetical protein [Gimesia fumaroli]|uniref:ATP-grasp domain-containing protein n=1 Tax=Gimesia fumaroli TaxID=2527976 RepID=A0A518I6L6_9PLAN|nr:hypothetical protein [Gimesia fumaroli]QDV48710.1 hypothetical protein Enr17x_07230 [Gimesia fumaroli]
MRRFFLGNFDFEHQLASEVYAASGGATPALNAIFASCWIGLAEEDDLLFLPGRVASDFVSQLSEAGLPRVELTNQWPTREQAAELEFVPWGWSDAVKRIAVDNGFQFESPDLRAVQTVNARTFSFACEQEWGLALPGSCQVNDLAELETAIRQLQRQEAEPDNTWVVKANFSMSARERMLGRGTRLTEQVIGWAAKRFAQGQPLFVEPWVKRTAEAGLQFFISREGEPEWLGLALLLSDERGQYRGSRITVDVETRREWQPAIEVGQRVALRAQAAGYFGPLGIDAMRFSDEHGEKRWRPIQDVNARYTMGRLALGFSRFLQPHQAASWLHFPWKESYGICFSNWLRCVSEQGGSGRRLIATSPDQIDGQTVRLVTVLLISETAEQLCQTEADLMQAVSELADNTG